MKYVSLPDDVSRRLPFYLAMEEYAASELVRAEGELFFMWQVNPTVIFGRNQLISREVDVDYCQAHGIATYRRKSGGGCVFADRSNIMFSYITDKSYDVGELFGRYTSMIAGMLRSLNLNASSSGRNDVLIDGRKVSGNAFYRLPSSSIIHGTMLYGTDMMHMARAITPSRSKLDAKGVASVQSHITTLGEHLDMGIEEFKEYVRAYLCDGQLMLAADDVRRIEVLSEPYYSPRWIMGHMPHGSVSVSRRVEGVGEFEVTLDIADNKIRNVNIGGDFFLVGDLDTMLLDYIKGTEYKMEAVAAALDGVTVSDVIHGLNNDEFVNLLF